MNIQLEKARSKFGISLMFVDRWSTVKSILDNNPEYY